MKKAFSSSFFLISSFVFVVVASAAVDPTANETTTNVQSYTHKGGMILRYDDAVYKRLLRLYNKHTVRNLDWKNAYNRENRLINKKIQANVDGPSATGAPREGDLGPGYQGLHQQPSYLSTGYKGDWRRCAVNYYVEGGNCSPEEMAKNLIYASVHKVDLVPDIFWKQDVSTIKDIRDIQRLLESSDMIGAGQQVQRYETKVSSYRDVGASPFSKLPTFGQQ